MEILKVENITKYYGNLRAVHNLSFVVQSEEILGLLGPNGAGKTTTIKMICGLLKPTDGKISVYKYDPVTEPSCVRAHIGYMPQTLSLYQDLTVRENIELFGGLHGLSGRSLKEREEKLVYFLGLEEWLYTKVGELPGGIKNRVSLSIALINDPPLLLLDEPTSGMDPLMRRTFLSFLYNLKSEGKAVIVTTHYLEEAQYMDRIILMHRGEKLLEGNPRELLSKVPFKVLRIKFQDLKRVRDIAKPLYTIPKGEFIDIIVEEDLLDLLETFRAFEVEPDFDHLFIYMTR